MGRSDQDAQRWLRCQKCRVEKRVSDRVEPNVRIETTWSFFGAEPLRGFAQQFVDKYGRAPRHYQH